MHGIVKHHRSELAELCRRFRVKRLDLFGSAARGTFNVETSDLDFLVEFEAMSDALFARSFLGLLTALEDLFARRVDLVTVGSLTKPAFRAEVERTRQPVYG